MEYAIPSNESTIARIQGAYISSVNPWYIGFSGGKDSSAVLKLVFMALMQLKEAIKPVTILYCDTGVDIPLFNKLVKTTLNSIVFEAKEHGVPFEVKIVSPPISDRFFSKLIGKGYPPPTNKFRWCTDRLRIKPVHNVLNSSATEKNIVLLGIRKGESVDRDNRLLKYEAESTYYYRQSGYASTIIFAPIIDYSTEEIWATIADNLIPRSIDTLQLMKLYRQASGECPILRDPTGTPCGKGRFGCWTCTVVRKDKSVQGLISEGHSQLIPLLSFRNWLMEVRDEPIYRLHKRRNGQEGLGPFTMHAREEILGKLIRAQKNCGITLIDSEEINYIEQCWEEDYKQIY